MQNFEWRIEEQADSGEWYLCGTSKTQAAAEKRVEKFRAIWKRVGVTDKRYRVRNRDES